MTSRFGSTLMILGFFVITYAATYEAAVWSQAYLLGLGDVKFGSPAANFRFAQLQLPVFLCIAIASYCAAVVIRWPWLRRARSMQVAGIATTAGVASVIVMLAPDAALYFVGWSLPSALNVALSLILQVCILGGPALATLAIVALVKRRAGPPVTAHAG